MRFTFSKDYAGKDGARSYKKGESVALSDFEAGRMAAGGYGSVDDSTDPASPKNLAGVDGRPIDPGGDAGDPYAKGAAGLSPEDDFVAGVKIDSKGEDGPSRADLQGQAGGETPRAAAKAEAEEKKASAKK